MGEFVCRVADANGRVYSHVEAAGTQAEARQKLADRGLYVYSVENRSGLVSGMLQRSNSRQVGGSDFLILNQQFNTLIKAGLPILRALDLLTDRAATPRLRPIVAQVRDRVREGKSLSILPRTALAIEAPSFVAASLLSSVRLSVISCRASSRVNSRSFSRPATYLEIARSCTSRHRPA